MNILKNFIDQRETFERVRNEFDLKFIILHGSYARGRARPQSDVDIAFVDKPLHPKGDFFKIYTAFEGILSQMGFIDLDIKSLKGVDPLFRYLVVRDSFLLAGNFHQFNEFKAFAFRDYMDSRGLLVLERKMIEFKQRMLSRRYVG